MSQPQNVVGLSGGPGAGPLWPATLGSADTARALTHTVSRLRGARRGTLRRPKKASAGRENPAAWPLPPRSQETNKHTSKERSKQQQVQAHPTSKPIRRRAARADEWPERRNPELVQTQRKRRNSFGGGRGGRTNCHPPQTCAIIDTRVTAR